MCFPQNLAAEKTYNDLDVSLRKANEHRNAWFEGVRKCTVNETLYTIMERIVRAEVHRLVITDDNSKVIGIISLSDILLFLVLRPTETSVSASTHNISLRETELFNDAAATAEASNESNQNTNAESSTDVEPSNNDSAVSVIDTIEDTSGAAAPTNDTTATVTDDNDEEN